MRPCYVLHVVIGSHADNSIEAIWEYLGMNGQNIIENLALSVPDLLEQVDKTLSYLVLMNIIIPSVLFLYHIKLDKY